MKKYVAIKLVSNKGESIAEVLVASLVITLGAIILFTMVNASFRILQNEEKKYKEFIKEKNKFEEEAFGEISGVGAPAQVSIRYGDVKTYEIGVTVYSKIIDDNTFYRYEVNNE
ncbi:MAG: hypothetical protein K6A70_10750 [Erysipelotrichaceae bacterium]|nr:hypothetical protein [Erysipelotrichaceae bacterium]